LSPGCQHTRATCRPEGLTRIIADKASRRVLGVGIVGEHAGNLVAECVPAMEMGATPDDLAMTNRTSAKRVAHAISVCWARKAKDPRELERNSRPQQVITR
jgi:hypothetical protein